MQLIPLTKGLFAQVDDRDYAYLMQWRWGVTVHKKQNTQYVLRKVSINGKQVEVYMHREIMGLASYKVDRFVIDHIDHNGLNNQRSNLRKCSTKENTKNKSSQKKSSSAFLGVCKKVHKNSRQTKEGVKNYESVYWNAQIQDQNKKKHFLGIFPFTPEGELMAAMAYDAAARKYHGEFANYNFKY